MSVGIGSTGNGEIRVHLDSKTFDDLLSNSDRTALALLQHRHTRGVDFVRSPLVTPHRELQEIVEYKFVTKDSEIQSIEVSRGGPWPAGFRFGYRMDDIRSVARTVLVRAP